MVHLNTLVACIKVNGKILREQGNNVILPFGSEFSVYIKNLNSVRALAKIEIDGKDVADGTRFIVPANGTFEIERFMRNGNMNAGNRFKFIQRTKEIEQNRGIGSDDGIVRVECWNEQIIHEQTTIIRRKYVDDFEPWYPDYPRPYPRPWPRRGPYWSASRGSMQSAARASRNAPVPGMDSVLSDSVCSSDCAVNDSGITVAGGYSGQQFYLGEYFPTETYSNVIVLHLRGQIGEKTVQSAVTIDHKPKCSTCGRTNKGNSKFCANCGTALELV